jgi:hypothetical protein
MPRSMPSRRWTGFSNATANLVKGIVPMEQQHYVEARDVLLKAAAADPDSLQAVHQLALVSARLGETAEVRRYEGLYQARMRVIDDAAGASRHDAMKRVIVPVLVSLTGAAVTGALQPLKRNGSSGTSRARRALPSSITPRPEEIHRRVHERRRGAVRLR